MQPISQVLELPETRVQVAAAAELDDRFAQHLFRMGHAQPETEDRRRRPLKELVLRADL